MEALYLPKQTGYRLQQFAAVARDPSSGRTPDFVQALRAENREHAVAIALALRFPPPRFPAEPVPFDETFRPLYRRALLAMVDLRAFNEPRRTTAALGFQDERAMTTAIQSAVDALGAGDGAQALVNAFTRELIDRDALLEILKGRDPSLGYRLVDPVERDLLRDFALGQSSRNQQLKSDGEFFRRYGTTSLQEAMVVAFFCDVLRPDLLWPAAREAALSR